MEKFSKRRAAKFPQIETAVDAKIDEQRKFVAWWKSDGARCWR